MTFKFQTIPAKAGIGLRAEHYKDVVQHPGNVSWYEVHPENYFGLGGVPHHYLEIIRRDHPISFHGVGMSIGSVDQLDKGHLKRLSELIDYYQPGHVSEHLSWSSVNGTFFNDLLPIPYTEEALDHVTGKIHQVQDELKQQIIIENASTYLQFTASTIPEWEFTNELAKRTGCGLLLDVNNVYVNACNHGFSARKYLSEVDPPYVKEIHLAGHTVKSVNDTEIRIDTHNQLICDPVWELYQYTISRIGKIATLIEWDTDLPEFSVLLNEADQAQTLMDQSCAKVA